MLATLIGLKDEFSSRAQKNAATLIKGSSIDPYNHPSYSAERVIALTQNTEKRAAAQARLNKKYGEAF